jgi:RNA polymerase subunit RPABC4/transcription elongation factor Spt4
MATHEKTFQMLWDCKFCGTEKLFGLDNRFCPNCGAQQDAEWRYFPSEADMKFVTDPDYKYAGADKVCPACETLNSRNAHYCKNCGADLADAEDAALHDKIDPSQDVVGVRRDVARERFEAQTAPKKANGNRTLLTVLAVVAVIVIGSFGGLLYLNSSTFPTSIEVTDKSWERVIHVEEYTARTQSDWDEGVPGDAYNVSCRTEQRSYQESERYVCGQEMVDNGDGTGRRVDKYCTRSVTRYRPDQYCRYTVNRWEFVRDLRTSGGANDPLEWAFFTPRQTSGIGAERESGREQTLIVEFVNATAQLEGESYTYNPESEQEWQAFRIGTRYDVEMNRLNRIQWESLQAARPR